MSFASFAKSKPSLVRRFPAVSYFVLTFAISWTGALLVAAAKLLQPGPLPKLVGILMFPAMLLGPCFAGIYLVWRFEGNHALGRLFSRMRFDFPRRFWLALAIPPILVAGVLLILRTIVSPAYSPNHFWGGVVFGALAGIVEEVGWMGFAYPRLRQRFAVVPAAVIVGVLWGLWHAPVIDFLGAASPHRGALPLFFAAFVAVLSAMRVLIAWLYEHTQSLAICQLMHISSTGALVVFGPPGVSPSQESVWYGVYAAVLWLTALTLISVSKEDEPA